MTATIELRRRGSLSRRAQRLAGAQRKSRALDALSIDASAPPQCRGAVISSGNNEARATTTNGAHSFSIVSTGESAAADANAGVITRVGAILAARVPHYEKAHMIEDAYVYSCTRTRTYCT